MQALLDHRMCACMLVCACLNAFAPPAQGHTNKKKQNSSFKGGDAFLINSVITACNLCRQGQQHPADPSVHSCRDFLAVPACHQRPSTLAFLALPRLLAAPCCLADLASTRQEGLEDPAGHCFRAILQAHPNPVHREVPAFLGGRAFHVRPSRRGGLLPLSGPWLPYLPCSPAVLEDPAGLPLPCPPRTLVGRSAHATRERPALLLGHGSHAGLAVPVNPAPPGC